MKIMSLLLLGLLVFYYGFDMAEQLEMWRENNNNITFYTLIFACIGYGLILMLPFMPALEAGLLIMSLYGVDGVIGTYVATVFALFLSFLLGCFFINKGQLSWFENRPISMLELSSNGLLNRALKKILNTASARPYLCLALLLNMPGNVMIGGGGGIAMVAGASGTLRLYKYVLTVSLATSIMPLLVLLGMLL